MKRKTYRLLILFALIASACSSAPAPATVIVEPTNPPRADGLPRTEADVPRVSVEEALAALNSGAAILVDVRSANSYAASHIEGAVSIPLERIEADPASLPLDKNLWIVTYCT